MKKWIRWKGVIPFACIAGLLMIFWILILDPMVERIIESTGTRAVGAKVEIDRADVSLFPAGVAITRLQVTHPEKPMTNAVEIASMELSLDSGALLRKKIIVDRLTMEGVRLNTARKTSGALPDDTRNKKAGESKKIKKTLEKAGCTTIELPSLKIPDIRKILEKENLESLQAIEDYQARLEAEKQEFQEALQSLPDQDTFAQYRRRIEKLQGKKTSVGGLLNTAKDVAQLKEEIDEDVERLEKERRSLQKRIRTLEEGYSQLSNAVQKDIRRIQDKYALSQLKTRHLGRLLAGARFCEWWEEGYRWYRRVEPYLQRPQTRAGEPETVPPVRGKGINVRFPEKNPMPDFLIRLARANIVLDGGELTGVIENLTADQHLVGRPAVFKFLGREMSRMASLNAIGEINHVQPKNPKYNFEADVKDFELNDFALSTARALPVVVKKGQTDADFTFSLIGSELSSRLNAVFQSVTLKAEPDDASGELAAVLTSAIADIDAFDVKVRVDGTVEDFVIDIRSDLDEILRTAVGDRIERETDRFRAGLEKEIMARVGKPMQQANQMLKTLNPIADELSKRLNLGTELLKTDAFNHFKLPL